jgi:SAM-dependent methyltransferase
MSEVRESPPLTWHRSCPACGQNDAAPIALNQMAPMAGLDMSYRVGYCLHCGFSYATDLATPETYADYYRLLSKYDVIDHPDNIPDHDRVRIRTAVELCQPHIQENAVIVDIGCGIGALLEGFRQANYRYVHGIDPAPDAHTLAQKLFGISTVQTGSLDEAERLLPLDKAGLVCLTGVLEHLPNLYEDMERIFQHLAAESRVLIEVPALERFTRTGMEPFGEFSLEHVQYFSKESLQRFMGRFGFTPVIQTIVEIPGLVSDSLFSLFSRTGPALFQQAGQDIGLCTYVTQSQVILDLALSRIAPLLAERFWVYGAGSHTARLIPRLNRLGIEDRIAGVIDSNPNLHGKLIGKHTIYPPQFLNQHLGEPVLISSHKAQNVIAQRLHEHHPLILIYP